MSPEGGLLPLLKPPGPSSRQLVDAVGRLAGPRVRAGHAGTLDPAAAGVLVVGLGRATRLLGFLQAAEKRYRFELVLGRTTDTGDATGRPLDRRDASGVTRAQVEAVLGEFTGRIRQRAPLYSARRVDGRHLYSYARQGEPVEAPEFDVDVHTLQLEGWEAGDPAVALCDLRCGGGTYVRALAEAIGERLGCGAHTGMLLRLEAGGITAAQCHALEEIEVAATDGSLADRLLAPATALAFLPAVALGAAEAERVRHGIPPARSGGGHGLVRLIGPDGALVAVAEEVRGQGIRLRCVLAAGA
jgi:tRNA pseudouridine55 synthase